ncbi:MAG: hypothetical protein ACMG57_05185 [Candidatus Dojkabacteria bacterium]
MKIKYKIKRYQFVFVVFFLLGIITPVLTVSRTLEASDCGPGNCYGHRSCSAPDGCGGCGCYPDGQCSGGCPESGNNGGDSCQKAAPLKATLTAPADKATNVAKPVTLKWLNNSFGDGCPSVPKDRILYKLKDTACTVADNTPYLITGPTGTRPYVLPVRQGESVLYAKPYQATPYTAQSNSVVLNAELEWGKTYCWKVQKSNGAFTSISAPSEFTTTKTPTYVAGGLAADVCGNNEIGRYDSTGSTGTTNPIEWSMTFSNPEPTNNIEWASLVFVKNTSAIAGAFVPWGNVITNAISSGGFVFSVSKNATGYVYSSYQSSPIQWNNAAAGATSINSPGNTASLIDLGTGTKQVTNGNQTTTTFRVRANSMPAGSYAVFAMAETRNGKVIIGSSDATASINSIGRRVGTMVVDLVPPAASLSGPSYQADGSFNLGWNAVDNFSLKEVYSYIYSDTPGSQLQDNTAGITINAGTTELSYPDASNAGVTKPTLGLRNYTDVTPGTLATYNYKLYARDSACNSSEGTAVSQHVTPWILGTSGDISSYVSIEKTRVPDIPNFTVPFTSSTGSSYFSEYSSISGSSLNAKGNASKHNEVVNNYLDEAVISTHDSSGTWYAGLLDKVKRNEKTSILPLSSRTISGDMASGLGTTANTRYGVEVGGDLTINSDTKCNLRAIVFVNGNLVINPDFTIAAAPNTPVITDQVYNGCLFIVKGNTTILTGTTKTNQPSSSSTLASYDIVEAYILTDGTLNIPRDTQALGQKEDGLYINGGAYAKSTMTGAVSSLKRDLKFEANNLQPSMFFNFDPRYKLMFSEDFASRDYEIREFGL